MSQITGDYVINLEVFIISVYTLSLTFCCSTPEPPAPSIHDPVIQCQGEDGVISMVDVAWTVS